MRTITFLLVLGPAAARRNYQAGAGRGDGSSMEKNVPVKWSATENIGMENGHPRGRPFVAGDLWRSSFPALLPARETERVSISLDRNTGKPLWQRTVIKTPWELYTARTAGPGHAVTDGKLIYVAVMKGRQDNPRAQCRHSPAHHPGSIEVVAFDQRAIENGPVTSGLSLARTVSACPVLYRDLVIVNGDHDGEAYIAALDRATGELRGRRRAKTRHAATARRSFARLTAATRWLSAAVNPSPAMTRPPANAIGSLTAPPNSLWPRWCTTANTSLSPAVIPSAISSPSGPTGAAMSPKPTLPGARAAAYVLAGGVGDYFLIVSDAGIASCFDAGDGTRHWMERLGGGHSASAITANGLAYFVSDRGITTVIRPGKEFEVGRKTTEGPTSSSPAISQGQLFIRVTSTCFALVHRANLIEGNLIPIDPFSASSKSSVMLFYSR